MAKLILEFDLSNEDDRFHYKATNKAMEMSGVLFDLLHNFRRKTEHIIEYRQENEELLPLTVHDIIMDELFRLIDEHDIHPSDVC